MIQLLPLGKFNFTEMVPQVADLVRIEKLARGSSKLKLS